MKTVPAQLVDARNWHTLKPVLLEKMSNAGLIGFDIETEDSKRHPGLAQFMKEKKKLVFDVNRTTVCGFSLYFDEDDVAYYVNLHHADAESRIPWEEAREVLDAKKADAYWIAHNAPFELTMMRKSLGYELGNIICTLQMAVSHHNEDQYPINDMLSCGFGRMVAMFDKISRAFINTGPELTEEQEDLLGKIVGKSTKASFSYNHLVEELSYGYGLKKLTKSLFGYQQQSFEETLGDKEHMGQLTGEEVCAYGADDAYWAVQIFHRLLPKMAAQNDKLVDTFFSQENPMVHVYSDIWSIGMRLDVRRVMEKREEERINYANAIRRLQKALRDLLPFPATPNKKLSQHDAWYTKDWERYRKTIEKWADIDLPEDHFEAAYTTAGAVTTAWASEKGLRKSPGPNLSYYRVLRTILHDLAGLPVIIKDGKVTSDKDARGLLRGKGRDDLLDILEDLSGIEQRMKLYLTPYLQLIDPQTGRVYPVVSSRLNSRRMAASFPNPMQLAKRGDSTYVRGFFLADEDDHLVVSIDWSQVELVEIGDFSGDPAFAEAYGQLPFKDLHTKAVKDMLEIDDPKSLPNFKELRTKIGKGANFNYWYSGALSTVGQNMGWSSDKMWEMTEKYRETFKVAEQWRVDLINEAREKGYITLPDGHRRVKYEASYEWQNLWRSRFEQTGNLGLANFGYHFVRAITNRAGNQIVNSMIQGSCATLAKRSILRINDAIKERGMRARFMIPIHDELVFSVHRDDVIEFLHMAKGIMCDHPDIITRLKLDATASIGRTFEPYKPGKADFGQIELDEAPPLPGWLPPETVDQKLNDSQIEQVIHYLFEEKQYALAA